MFFIFCDVKKKESFDTYLLSSRHTFLDISSVHCPRNWTRKLRLHSVSFVTTAIVVTIIISGPSPIAAGTCASIHFRVRLANTTTFSAPVGLVTMTFTTFGLCDHLCLVLVCRGRYCLGGGFFSYSGIEFGRSRTSEGSLGGRKKGVV
jgi:hypothetical protein